MNWREARGDRTIEEVMDTWKTSDIPLPIRRDLSVGKYTRLDRGDAAGPQPRINAVAKWELARILGVELRDVDPDAADEFDAIVQTLGTQRGPSTTCYLPSVDIDLTAEHALEQTVAA